MAWAVATWTIKPGVTHRWWISWPYHPYMGAQFIQARPLGAVVGSGQNWFQPEAELFTFDQSVRYLHPANGEFSYGVSVRNAGPTEIWYDIHGGGVT
jgi:hypothetical protein